MKTLLAVATLAVGIALAPTGAGAHERFGDGAMGALAGAVVAGPVGAVAGGVIGYMAGPHIARRMGLKGHRRHHHYYADRDDRRW